MFLFLAVAKMRSQCVHIDILNFLIYFHDISIFKKKTCVPMLDSAILYPSIFRGFWFFDECSQEKNCYAAGESASTVSLPQWGPWAKKNFCWQFCILNSSKHHSCQWFWSWTMVCLFLAELVFAPLRVWGSKFGIPNWYTGFRIALDTALFWI